MTYALSDIHGNLRRFESMLEQIDPQPADTLYILGDVIDRHPDGIQLLRRIMEMPNVRMLLGNHEYMMMRALGAPYDGISDILGKSKENLIVLWYRNGGGVTHKAWKCQRKAVREDILDYLRALPLNIDVKVGEHSFKFVHGGPMETYPKYGTPAGKTPTYFAVWNRELDALRVKSGQTVIFGHTPTENFQSDDPLKIWYGDGMIGIDCGCGYPECEELLQEMKQGRLACLRLDDMQEFYLA